MPMLTDINLISLQTMIKPMRLKAKVRYRYTEQWATVIQLESDTLRVSFDEPQIAVTKGQSVVLYDGDIVVGGGIIVETFPHLCYNDTKNKERCYNDDFNQRPLLSTGDD